MKNLSVLVFVNFAIAGIGFFTQIKIANELGKESFGYIAYGVAIATYCAVIIRFALDRTLVRDLIHYPNRFTSTVKASLMLRLLLLVFVVAMLLIWKAFQPPTSDITWGVLLIVFANSLMSMDLQGVYDSWHKMSRHALYNLVQRCLYFTVIWFLIINVPEYLSVFSVGLATLISVLVYLGMQYNWAIKKLPKDESNENILLLAFNMARGNVFVWFAALAGLSFGPLNQLILKNYHGAAELGGYAAAWMMVTLVTMLLTQVARVGNPSTASLTSGSASIHRKVRFLFKYAVFMLLMSMPVALLAINYPDLILKILFKPEYATAASALHVMGLYMPVFAIGLIASQYLISSRMEKEYLKSVLIGGLVGVVLCFVIIPEHGAIGASWVLLISHGLSIICYVYFVIREITSNQDAEYS